MKTFTIKEFDKLTAGKTQWWINLCGVIINLFGEGMVSEEKKGNYILSIWGDKNILEKEGRSLEGDCMEYSSISQVQEGKKYLIHIGDHYELEVSVLGEVILLSSADFWNNFLLMQTAQGSILQAHILNRSLIYGIEIIDEIVEFTV